MSFSSASLDTKKNLSQPKGYSLRKDRTYNECENEGNVIYTECSECGELVKHELRCHKRFESLCKTCSEEYRKKWFAKYRDAWNKMNNPKLVTLTLRKKGNMEDRLKELTSLANRCRFYLKRRGYEVKRHVWVMEPPNHIHALWDTCFIPQHELSEVWQTVSGDSFIVDIRKANSRKGANYLLKYLTKASSWSDLNLSALEGVNITGSWNILDDDFEGFVCPNKSCSSTSHFRVGKEYFQMEIKENKPPPDQAGGYR